MIASNTAGERGGGTEGGAKASRSYIPVYMVPGYVTAGRGFWLVSRSYLYPKYVVSPGRRGVYEGSPPGGGPLPTFHRFVFVFHPGL